jgi:hypothetical protein
MYCQPWFVLEFVDRFAGRLMPGENRMLKQHVDRDE